MGLVGREDLKKIRKENNSKEGNGIKHKDNGKTGLS